VVVFLTYEELEVVSNKMVALLSFLSLIEGIRSLGVTAIDYLGFMKVFLAFVEFLLLCS
jgi:hypothetical protein